MSAIRNTGREVFEHMGNDIPVEVLILTDARTNGLQFRGVVLALGDMIAGEIYSNNLWGRL